MIEIWSKPQCPFCDMAENLCIQKDFEYKNIEGIKNKDFNDFLEYKKNLPIISSEEALKII